MLMDLPASHITWTWTNFRSLRNVSKEVHDRLQENNKEGNQYVVVLGLSKYAIGKLADEADALGRNRLPL